MYAQVFKKLECRGKRQGMWDIVGVEIVMSFGIEGRNFFNTVIGARKCLCES